MGNKLYIIDILGRFSTMAKQSCTLIRVRDAS